MYPSLRAFVEKLDSLGELVRIKRECDPKLAKVIRALGAVGRFPRALHGRQKQRNQHAHDGDDNEKFDEGKTGLLSLAHLKVLHPGYSPVPPDFLPVGRAIHLVRFARSELIGMGPVRSITARNVVTAYTVS